MRLKGEGGGAKTYKQLSVNSMFINYDQVIWMFLVYQVEKKMNRPILNSTTNNWVKWKGRGVNFFGNNIFTRSNELCDSSSMFLE